MPSAPRNRKHPTPVFFFSHGSTMMLGEDTSPAHEWKAVGDEALRRGVKSIIMMGAHWETLGDRVEVAMNPNPQMTPVAYVAPDRYQNYKLSVDLNTGQRVINMLRAAGINAHANPTFDFIHDTFLVLIRMFPEQKTNIPVVVISANARMDPHLHARMGTAVRPLRYEDALVVGSGGAVHNLYRNNWMQMVLWRDNLAMPQPPQDCMLEFRQAFEDAVTINSGPALRRAVTRLMKHPLFRDAHGTDEHFISSCFVAGAAGDREDEGTTNRLTSECWELVNMANSQFQLGEWE